MSQVAQRLLTGRMSVFVALLMLSAISFAAFVVAKWVRSYGPAWLKDSFALSIFTILAAGLFVYWPWKFAATVTLVIGACVAADFAKRKGYWSNGSK